MRLPTSPVLLILATLGATACAHSPQEPGQRRPPSDVITADQIRELGVTNAYDAVERLQARWLLTTQGPVLVYVDERALGSASTLRTIPAADVATIRFYPFAQAIGRFPEFTGGAGVIHVTTKAPAP